MKLLLIISHHDRTDVVWNALRFADAALSSGHEVNIFLMNDAVDLARKRPKPETAEFDLGNMLL